MKKNVMTIVIISILVGILTSCSAKASTEPILTMTGLAEITWTESELKSFDLQSVEYVGKDGESTTYEGISLNNLFDAADIKDFEKCTFVAADGYIAEVSYTDLIGCEDCVLVFQEESGLRTVMPDFSGKQQVKGLVEIQVN